MSSWRNHMRPKRLSIHGFASFRDQVEIDFDDAELFVLSGPTGSGKSSIIDAMIFALYGAVPRYGKQATTAIVSKGRNEARVSLAFEVGAEEYTATRIVRMQSSGSATTKEARLEQGDRVLADSSSGVEQVAAKIIGLKYEDFIRCVVLPQGAFQEFMHARPSERGDMLVSLLGLGLYEEARKEAFRRSESHKKEIDIAERRLAEDYAAVTPETLEAARRVREKLEAQLNDAKQARGKVDELKRELEEGAAKSEQLANQLKSLSGVSAPNKVEVVAEELQKGKARITELNTLLRAASAARQELEKQRQGLPERSQVAAQMQLWRDAHDLGAEITNLRTTAEAASADQKAAEKAETKAKEALVRTEDQLESARRRNRAAHLAESLVEGETCPVCLQVVDDLPNHGAEADLDELKEATEAARKARDAAIKAANSARTRAAQSEVRLQDAENRSQQLAKELDELPVMEALEVTIQKIEDLEAQVNTARESETKAEQNLRQAEEGINEYADALEKAWEHWKDVRGRITRTGLDAPDRIEGDLLASWRHLGDWASHEAKRIEPLREVLKEAKAAKQKEVKDLLNGIEDGLKEGGIPLAEGEDPVGVLQDAFVRAKTVARDLEAKLEKAKALRKGLQEDKRAEQTARELARLLGAREFEGWMIRRALEALVLGASQTLRELSAGAYSLEVGDQNEFAVIDHLNADERRSAKSLSGGETFLASLSLALALAEQVAELGIHGGAKLEALFLDEGFGTLDPETLDVVATALEEMGSRGRMIGLITHVQDLAERMPVRFELRKEGNVSSITKLVA